MFWIYLVPAVPQHDVTVVVLQVGAKSMSDIVDLIVVPVALRSRSN